MPDRGRYRRAALIGALAAILVATAVFTIRNAPGQNVRAATSSAAKPGASPSTNANGVPVDPGEAVSGLLRQRGDAVLDRSRTVWLSTVTAKIRSFQAAQSSVFTRIAALRPVSWTYAFTAARPATSKQTSKLPGSWIAEVDLTYRLTAGGPSVTRHQYLLIAPNGPGAWQIAGNTAGPTQIDLWDINPITVVRQSRCLVIASASWRSLSQRVASSCARAAKRVDSVWGTNWPRSTVLVIPDSQKQLATLLDRSDKGGTGLENTAAVTIGPASSAAEEVLVNPAVFKEFPALGIRVVLAHELTHVATRATGAYDAPTWLSEGFADFVGFGDSGLSPHEIAGDALDQVAGGTVPQTFPADGDFDAAGKNANAAYGYSWALARTIEERVGLATAVRFYRAVATPATGTSSGPGTSSGSSTSTGPGNASTASGSGSESSSSAGTQDARLTAAIREVLGMKSQQQLIDAWQGELRSLA